MQPGDGLTIVTFHFGMVTQALIKSATVKFDPLKYTWLGDPAIGGLPPGAVGSERGTDPLSGRLKSEERASFRGSNGSRHKRWSS